MRVSDQSEKVQIKHIAVLMRQKQKEPGFAKSSHAFGQRSLLIPQWDVAPSVSLYRMESFNVIEQRTLI